MPTGDHSFSLLPWQEGLWKSLRRRMAQNSMPHALLLTGPEGIGKRKFAEYLAASLVCEEDSLEARPCGECRACQLLASSTHPDIHWLEPEEEGKNIRIDAVRELIARTTLTTQAKGSRVFVISPAHAMNRASANALLKTLEEPTSSSTMVLVSSQPHLLPATIRSRCQNLVFKPVGAEMAKDWLSSRVPEPQLVPLLSLTGGAPLAALRAAEDNWLQAAEQTLGQLNDLKLRKVNPMQVVEEWNARPLDSLFTDFSRICSDLVQLGSSEKSTRLFLPGYRESLRILANGMDLKRLFGFIDELNRLKRQMTHNLNPQMLLEKIVTDWLALTRPEVS